jgi:hypothetical protein
VIAFDMECSKGHRFEGWFNSLASFEEQSARKLVSCPICSITRVKRVLSAVAVKNSSRQDKGEEKETAAIDYTRLAKEIVDYINNSFDDVGSQFTQEALKMHYGVTEKKNIRGSATSAEEKVLKQEKIEFFKLPVPASAGKKKKN